MEGKEGGGEKVRALYSPMHLMLQWIRRNVDSFSADVRKSAGLHSGTFTPSFRYALRRRELEIEIDGRHTESVPSIGDREVCKDLKNHLHSKPGEKLTLTFVNLFSILRKERGRVRV